MMKSRIVLLEDYPDFARQLECLRTLSERADLKIYTSKSNSDDETVDRVKDADCIITIRDRVVFTRELLSRMKHVKLISVCGARLSHIDIAAATEYGIKICAPSLSEQGVAVKAYAAEQTWNLILGFLKGTAVNAQAMAQGKWQTVPARNLFGKTLGILGLGSVGKQVAVVAKAMKMDVLAWSPHLTQDRAEESGAQYVPFKQIFSESDIVSVHAPLSTNNRNMIGEAELKLMRPHSVLINSARAALIDETALRRALEKGAIAGAAFDVYWEEPLPADHWLRRQKNVLLQPHLGLFTDEGYASLLIPAIENVMMFLDGKPRSLVNA